MQSRKSLAYMTMVVFSCGAFCPLFRAEAAVPTYQAEQQKVGDIHLSAKNLAYRYKDMFMAANVVGYNYIGGMMLPLTFTAGLTGSFVQVDANQGRATGWIENPETPFSIDIARRLVVVNGEERVLPQGVVSVVGNEMYVDASYLASILPLNYKISYETGIIELQPQRNMRVFQRLDFMNQYFENIRKQAGLPYHPWTLEEARAATSPSEPFIQQPALPSGLAGEIEQTPFSTPSVSQTAPVGAVASSDVSPDGERMDSGEPYEWADETPVGEASTKSTMQIPGQNIVLETSGNQAALVAESNPVLDDNRLLILQPELNRIKGDYIEAYQHGNGYYLPLGYLMDLLELGIGVNPDTLEASGFFITEDKTFYLNGKTNEAVVAGEKISFPSGLVVANPFELYVDAQLLSQLLPLDFRLNMSDLVLTILPREQLPLQASLKRNQKWDTVTMWKQFNSDPYRNAPEIKTPYKLATVPSADVQLNSFYRDEDGSLDSQASALVTGDVGYLNTEAFAVVDMDEEDTVSTLRIKAGRSDKDGELLGPLKAKEVYAGDVQSYPMPLVSNSALGRGVKISNRDLLRPDQFDKTDFYGDAQPGWEVELYQNNVLIDFQIVGDDGRYAFTNVPINYGDNTFRIVLYGPQGQKQEEVREFNIDDQMPAVGKFQYAVSANEKGTGLISLDDNSQTSSDTSGPSFISMAEYGVNENLSLGGGFAHVPVQDAAGNVGEYNFASAALRTSLLGVRTNFNTAYDIDNGGWAAGVTGLTRYGLTTLRGEQRIYNDFDSAERLRSFIRPLTAEEILAGDVNRAIKSRMVSRTDLSASRPLTLSGLGNVSASSNFFLETFEEGESDASLSARLSKNFKGSNIAGSLRYRMLDRGAQSGGEFLDGSLNLRHNFDNDLLLRAAMRYQFVPDLEIAAVNLSLQKQLDEDLTGRLEYTESFAGSNRRRVAGYLSWDFDKFFLSPRIEFDENFDYLLGLGVQFSLGMDPRTNNFNMTSERIATTGAISARAFLDENADGIMNENEQPLEGAKFNNNYETDADGLAYIPRLTVFQPSRLVMDRGSVAGIGASPKESAYAVIARPGVTTEVDYAVVPTLEIEGKAYLQRGSEELEYPGLQLELVNKDGETVREVRTEFDGYYYIPDIYPGQYTLRVAQAEVESNALSANEFSIDTTELRDEGKFEGFVSGYDFLVTRASSQPSDAQEIQLAQEEAILPAQPPVEAVPVEPVVVAETEVEIEAEAAAAVETAVAEQAQPQIPPVLEKAAPPARETSGFAKIAEPRNESRLTFVQAGMYCDYANGQRQVDTLVIAGFEASLKARNYKGRSCYVVHVGPAQDLAEAETITRQLQDMGLEKPVIVEENSEVYE